MHNKLMLTSPRSPQRQDSVTDQLFDVIHLANHYGCYDAADWIRNALEAGRQDGSSWPEWVTQINSF